MCTISHREYARNLINCDFDEDVSAICGYFVVIPTCQACHVTYCFLVLYPNGSLLTPRQGNAATRLCCSHQLCLFYVYSMHYGRFCVSFPPSLQLSPYPGYSYLCRQWGVLCSEWWAISCIRWQYREMRPRLPGVNWLHYDHGVSLRESALKYCPPVYSTGKNG